MSGSLRLSRGVESLTLDSGSLEGVVSRYGWVLRGGTPTGRGTRVVLLGRRTDTGVRDETGVIVGEPVSGGSGKDRGDRSRR